MAFPMCSDRLTNSDKKDFDVVDVVRLRVIRNDCHHHLLGYEIIIRSLKRTPTSYEYFWKCCCSLVFFFYYFDLGLFFYASLHLSVDLIADHIDLLETKGNHLNAEQRGHRRARGERKESEKTRNAPLQNERVKRESLFYVKSIVGL